MQAFIVELTGGRKEHIVADAYQQEGALTTFFVMGSDRSVIDSWSRRVASLRCCVSNSAELEEFARTADLIAIRSNRLAEELVAA